MEPEDILAVLYRYGPPREVSALAALLTVQFRERRWQHYMADMGYNLLYALCGKKPDVPTFSEMMKPKSRDTRTAQQIKDDLIADLDRMFPG